MTDQVTNALNILSYFSTLLDPTGSSAANHQRAAAEVSLPNSSGGTEETPPASSSPCNYSADSQVSLNLTNQPHEGIGPVLLGLKLPITLGGTKHLPNCSNLIAASASSIDHQTFFLINPVFSPSNLGAQKTGPGQVAYSPAPPLSSTLANDAASQSSFNESEWLVRCNSAPIVCSANQSVNSVKSEALVLGRSASSEKDDSANSSPTWRETGEDGTTFQFSCANLSFSIPPFSPTNDSKQYFENELARQNGLAGAGSDPNQLQLQNHDPRLASTPATFQSGLAIKEEKVCAVCGDRALGCNFDVVSCESCKAFFRRNAFKEQKIKCLFDGNCQITVHTRRFCSYCRLKQCLAAGMKKDLILGVEEKKRRMEVVRQNRKRRSDESVSSTTATTNSMTTPATNSGSTTSAEMLHSDNTNLLTLARLDPVMSSAATSATASVTQSNDAQLVRKLTAEESHMLIDLNQVYDLSFTVDLEPLIHITQLNPSLNQLVNQSSYTVLRLIKFAKRLDDFVKLSQDLQISILKGCWFHLLLLRPVSLFDADRDGWITPRGVIPTDILKNATGYVQLHEDHLRYCRSIKSIIGNDVMLLVILLVLVLFAPDGPHVVSREVISNIQDRYVILLKHYLEAKYTFKKSAQMFPQLLEKIRELNLLVDNHAKILMDINPQEIEPIMLEMLDYKS